MPILNPNSTNYVHTSEPNTSNLHMAMAYNSDGEPVLRVTTTGGSAQVYMAILELGSAGT